MKKRSTTLRALWGLLAVIGLSSVANAQAPVKKVLAEEFTGTWCGWCPRGIYAIETLKKQYGDRFIAVSIHNGDPMTTPSGDSLQASLPGFPDGWLNRRSFTGSSIDIDPGDWAAQIGDMLDEEAEAGVTVDNVTFDPKTRIFSARVTTKFVKDVTGDIRMNLYLTEDSISGPAGSTYDQHNYYADPSNASQDPTSPFHNEPSVIPGIFHMNVVRALVGGALGVPNVIPQSAKAGSSYSVTFSMKLPLTWNPDRMHAIGFANYFTNLDPRVDPAGNEVLNSDFVKVTNLAPIAGAGISVAAQTGYMGRSKDNTFAITVRDTTGSPITMDLSVDAANSTLPAGWTAKIEPATVTVAANSTATATLTVTTNDQANFGIITVAAMPTAENRIGHVAEATQYNLSEGTKYMMYGATTMQMNNFPAQYKKDMATMPYVKFLTTAFPVKNYDLVGFSLGVAPIDWTAAINSLFGDVTPMSTITALMKQGGKIFISQEAGGYFARDNNYTYKSYVQTKAAQNFYDSTLGLKYTALTSHSDNTGNPIVYNVYGVNGDDISNGVNAPIGIGGYSCNFTFNANTSTQPKPIFYYTPTASNSTVAGVKATKDNSRIVFLDFILDGITDQNVAGKVYNNAINWLMGTPNGVDAVEPVAEIKGGAITASPNPFSSSTAVRYEAKNGEQNVQMSVVDILGREVAQLAPKASGNIFNATLNGSELPVGSYHVVVRSSEGTHQIPVMITR